MVHTEQSKSCSHPRAVEAQPAVAGSRPRALPFPLAGSEPSAGAVLPAPPSSTHAEALSGLPSHLRPWDCWPSPTPLAWITAGASLLLPLSRCPPQRPLQVPTSCASPLPESLQRLPRSHLESDTNSLPCRQGPSDHLCRTSHQPPPCPPDYSALPSPTASDHSCTLFPSWGLSTCPSSDRNVLPTWHGRLLFTQASAHGHLLRDVLADHQPKAADQSGHRPPCRPHAACICLVAPQECGVLETRSCVCLECRCIPGF